MFYKIAPEYFDNGLRVVPITPKTGACYVADWQNYDFENSPATFIDALGKSQNLNHQGIGLMCGKVSGVICIDIDTKDKKLQQEIYNQLPPLYFGKIGNKEKGINYFFKYNGEPNLRMDGLDIISDKGMTVLPPSIHKSGSPYEWAGSGSFKELPDLPSTFIDWAIKKFKKDKGESIVTKSDGSRCNHNSNTRLSKIGKAMYEDGCTVQEIAERLIEEDSQINEKISYFLCPERRWRCNDLEVNAMTFSTEFFKGNVPNRTKVIINIPKAKKKARKLPHLRGVAGKMFDYIYNNSPVPRSRFAYASALTAVSMIIGNRIRFGNIHPNLYALLVCPSGGGKDFPMKFPKKMLHQNNMSELLGQENPASDTGVLMTLTQQPKRLDTIDEADILFSGINAKNSPWASKMADVYASLYTSCGGPYAGKITASTKKVGACENPFITMIGSITPAAFRNSVTINNVEKGLGARFMYFIDERFKEATMRFQDEPMPLAVTNFINTWRPKEGEIQLNIPNIDITPDAQKDLEDYHDKIQKLRREKKDSRLAAIYNRLYEHAVTLLIIDTCSTNPRTTEPVINRDNVAWAMRAIQAYTEQMTEFIDDNIADSNTERERQAIIRVVKRKGNSATKSEITLGTRQLKPPQRDMLLKELVESELLTMTEKISEKTGRKSKLYILTGE